MIKTFNLMTSETLFKIYSMVLTGKATQNKEIAKKLGYGPGHTGYAIRFLIKKGLLKEKKLKGQGNPKQLIANTKGLAKLFSKEIQKRFLAYLTADAPDLKLIKRFFGTELFEGFCSLAVDGSISYSFEDALILLLLATSYLNNILELDNVVAHSSEQKKDLHAYNAFRTNLYNVIYRVLISDADYFLKKFLPCKSKKGD
jgi:hypothetical protein